MNIQVIDEYKSNERKRFKEYYRYLNNQDIETNKTISIFLNKAIYSNSVKNFINRIYDYKSLFIDIYFYSLKNKIVKFVHLFQCTDDNIKKILYILNRIKYDNYNTIEKKDIIKYILQFNILDYRIYE